MLIQDKKLLKDLSVMACPKILGQSTYTHMYIDQDLWQLVTGICDEGDALTLCE
jgi:hypothetical protein